MLLHGKHVVLLIENLRMVIEFTKKFLWNTAAVAAEQDLHFTLKLHLTRQIPRD